MKISAGWLDYAKCVLQSSNKHLPSAIPSFLLGLAPGGGCLAAGIATGAGERLTRLFTLTCAFALAKAIGGLFLWPDPVSCLAPGFPRHHALWSADFPQEIADF